VTNETKAPVQPSKRPKRKASVAAREAEAAGNGFVLVEQSGIELRIPIGGKVPIAAIDAFRAGDNYEGTKQLLGKEQWKLLSDAGITADDLDELGNKLLEHQGN